MAAAGQEFNPEIGLAVGGRLGLNMQPTNGDRNAVEGQTIGPSLDDGI